MHFSRFFRTFAVEMRKSVLNIIMTAVALAVLTGCSGDGYTPELLAIDTLMSEKPDSALRLLDSLSAGLERWPRSQRMRHSLLTMKARNKAYVPFTSDSLANDLVSYYDCHGTPNDRLLAHYLLGCVYRDINEAPLAVDCFLDAVNLADTTAADCDYNTLTVAYSQMGKIYHQQLLLSDEIKAYKHACRFSYMDKDTVRAIYHLEEIADAYILMNKKDSAEQIIKEAQRLYLKHGYKQRALQASLSLLYMYVKTSERLPEAKQLISQFESESDWFDKNHELPPSRRQYYSYIGQYYDQSGQLDSAEYYYRKISRPNMSFVQKDPMYRGLLSVYKKHRQADSIAKYAQLYCEANDSSIANKNSELTAQMASLYNYNRNQKIAEQEKQNARNTRNLLASVVVIVIGCGILIHRKRNARQKEMKQLSQRLFLISKEREGIANELEQLKANNYEALIVQKEQKEKELNDIIASLQSQMGQAGLEDSLQQLKESGIVKLFNEKKVFKQGVASPTKMEWKNLEQQFRRDMQATYTALTKANLSQMEFRICMLLIIGFNDKEINTISYSAPQSISKAKRRANNKLFNTDNAQSLKKNLITRFGV